MTKKKTNPIEDFGLKSWQFTYDRRMSYQRIKLFNYGYCHQLSKFFKADLNSEIYRIIDGNVSVYYESNDHKKAFSGIQKMILEDKTASLIKKIHKTIVDILFRLCKRNRQ